MAPVQTTGADRRAPVEATRDESIRPGTATEVLSALGPAFRSGCRAERFRSTGRHVTVGNSSPINDGAAAVLITSATRPAPRLHGHPPCVWRRSGRALVDCFFEGRFVLRRW
ncbi:thiolase family protein [Streptomyces scopuliridis]